LGTAVTRGETTFAATPDRHGFFQLVGVPAGEHELSVECSEATASKSVVVSDDVETLIEEPIVLAAAVLDVVVTPRLDPERRPWRLSVYATAPRWRAIAEAAAVSAEGRWSRRGLPPGSYHVEIASEDGTVWARRALDLADRLESLAIAVPLLAVSGRVQLASRPLSARLEFSDGEGGEPVRVDSREDGLFDASLPVARSGAGRRWTVEVHSVSPPVNRRLENVAIAAAPGETATWLELTLPVVGIRGSVLSEDGGPQGGAVVTAENADTASRTVVTTDGAGSFEIASLPPATYRLTAEAPAGSSEPASVEVAEGAEQELQLVLRRATRLTGRVVSDEGPVEGAGLQIWVAPGVPRTFVSTDAQGRFEASLPPETADVGITVTAPGFPVKLTRETFVDGEPITITLAAPAGRLELVVPPDAGSSSVESTGTYLACDGAIESVGTLATWAQLDGGGEREGEVVVPRMEPGLYALCRLGPQDQPAVWRGALPSQRCATGELAAGGTLRLSLP
jgi:hypothetical protein